MKWQTNWVKSGDMSLAPDSKQRFSLCMKSLFASATELRPSALMSQTTGALTDQRTNSYSCSIRFDSKMNTTGCFWREAKYLMNS